MAFFMKKAPTIQTVVKMIQEKGADYGKAPYNGLKDPQDSSKGQKSIVSLPESRYGVPHSQSQG